MTRDLKNNSVQPFDTVALEYDFMAETFHSSTVFVDHLPDKRQSALDLGCGSGFLATDLAPYFEDVIAIDISLDMLRIAHAKRKPANVSYCQMDVSQLGLSAQFDYITSQNVFHHLDDIPYVLDHLKGLLKPGGRLILMDVVSERETPPTAVYIIGAFQEYIPNLFKYGHQTANRIFRFRISRHWLSHLASDRYLSQSKFQHLYRQHLPDCTFPRANCVMWDKPMTT